MYFQSLVKSKRFKHPAFFSMNTIPIHGEMIVQTFEMMSHMLACEGPNV